MTIFEAFANLSFTPRLIRITGKVCMDVAEGTQKKSRTRRRCRCLCVCVCVSQRSD